MTEQEASNCVASTEDMYYEATKRLEQLGVSEEILEYFVSGSVVPVYVPEIDSLVPFDEALQKRILEFQKAHNAIVYLVTRSQVATKKLEFTTVESLAFVDNNIREWPDEVREVSKGRPMAYTYDIETPNKAEIARIELTQTAVGRVKRVL